MKNYLIIFVGVMYVSNCLLLKQIYPNVSEDYDAYVGFNEDRAEVYEFMFTILFYLIFIDSKGIYRSIALFFMILAAGSFIDKTIFHIKTYLWTDILLVLSAFLTSYIIYARENKHTQ